MVITTERSGVTGMPDLVFHPDRPDNGIITGLAAIEPDPRAPNNDLVLDAVLQAATGLQQLLQFRDSGTAASAADHEAGTACLLMPQPS